MDFSSRIKILNLNEVQELYSLPKLSQPEQELYFSVDSTELSVAYSYRTLIGQIFFILQLGYFKAKKMFFLPSYEEVRQDITFIKDKYFNRQELSTILDVSKTTYWNQQQKILYLCQYQYFDDYWKFKLQEKGSQSVRISPKPEFIFKELFHYLEKSKVVLPSYSTMQDIISKILIEEKQRLCTITAKHINIDTEKALQDLITREDKSYLLTSVKKETKSFQYKQIKREINKKIMLKPLYDFAKDFLPLLKLSNENIKYYASLVDYYSVFKLKRFGEDIFRIYIICFIYVRYQRINDNLVVSFIYLVKKYAETAKLAAKEQIYQLKVEINSQLKNAAKILNLFLDETIADETTFTQIKQIAFSILEKDKLPPLIQYISKIEFDQTEFEWQQIESLASTFKKNLRPTSSVLDICSTNPKDSFIDAIDFLKTNIFKKKTLASIKGELFPKSFISRKHKRYIFKNKKIKIRGSSRKILEVQPSRYEFLVYSLIRQYFEAGDIYISDSNRFRSFEDYLVDDESWKNNKQQLLLLLDQPFLSTPIEETLSLLQNQLETLIVEVNQRIKDGKNQAIKVVTSEKGSKWTLPYIKPEDITNHPLFDYLPQTDIMDLLVFVDSKSNFMSAFTHISKHLPKAEEDTEAIIGSLIALATNKGIIKMAESSDLTYQNLFSVTKNYLRLETIKKANDLISNSTFLLPIFQYFNVQSDVVHSSSDGQKFETQFNTINSRYSPKYFGLKKGVVAYTMVANNIPVNAKIIGAHEHESNFVFDIIHNNTSDIQPERHSVDTHGTNNVNFLLLHAFGYIFAPRYKDIHSKSQTLYGFNKPSFYNDLLLKPTKKIKPQLIVKEWPNVQRILVSLGLKTTTQSVIVSKLSSYARKNRTKKAMWELDNIFRSLYLLTYIDDILLRQDVQKVLNRSEAFNRLRRAIFHEFGGKFRVHSEEEQELWSECSRLVANAIIFYNSFLLSQLLTQLQQNNNTNSLEYVKTVSPIAWRHINLAGRFEFTSQRKSLDVDSIIAKLSLFLTNSKG